MKYQAYAEYKDSGVEWLGEVPAHWLLCSFRHSISDVFNGLTSTQVDEAEDTVAVTRIETISTGVIDEERLGFISCKEAREDRKLALGDILFSNINSLNMVGNCAIYTGGRAIYAGMNLLVLKPANSVKPKWLYWLIKSPVFRQVIESLAKPAINQASISQSSINSIGITVPLENEQQTIANFLDYETAKIDTLIEKQQLLIQLLKEKRQAVISHAVTKGLNPDLPMRDSGVEWLGEVPAHWIVRRLKHTSNLQSGIPKGKDLTGKKVISVPMLRVANVQDGYLDLNDVHEIEIEPAQLERYSLIYGDVLMNEGGDNDKLGRGAVWKSEIMPCIHQNHVFAIRPFSIEPEWLDLLTRASYAKFYFYMVAKQSTNLASISSTNLKEIPLVMPPADERLNIINYIYSKLKVFDNAEEKCSSQIILLQERRTALISAAVTGKIDVRNWQPSKGVVA